jgi:hypothetical protein
VVRAGATRAYARGPPPPAAAQRAPRPTLGEGSAVSSVGGRGGGAAPAGVGVRCGATREGQGVTGVCDRGRWLLQARAALPGACGHLPMPATRR